MTPQPCPAIWTVDGPVRSTAERTAASLGSDTGPSAWGGSPVNTTGNPSVARNDSMRANTPGGEGMMLFIARRMRDSFREWSKLVYRLFTTMLATSQAATRVAKTATT